MLCRLVVGNRSVFFGRFAAISLNYTESGLPTPNLRMNVLLVFAQYREPISFALERAQNYRGDSQMRFVDMELARRLELAGHPDCISEGNETREPG